MSYVNHGIAWTHPALGPRYSGKVGIRRSTCKHADDVEQTYGHCLATGEPEDVVSIKPDAAAVHFFDARGERLR